MKLFQLRYLDKCNAMVLSRGHAARHDFEAISEAERISATHTIEVWDGERRVARVNRGALWPRPRHRMIPMG